MIFVPLSTNRSSEMAYTISHRYCPAGPVLKGRFSDHIFTGKRIHPFLPMGRKVKLKSNVKIPISLGEELGTDIVVWVSDQVSNPSK